jgi:hypothetical protein
MILTDEIWYIVRNTRGVTGFVGPSSSKPTPLTEEELMLMGLESSWDRWSTMASGIPSRLYNGPLESFIGTVEEINLEKKKGPRAGLHVWPRDSGRAGTDPDPAHLNPDLNKFFIRFLTPLPGVEYKAAGTRPATILGGGRIWPKKLPGM